MKKRDAHDVIRAPVITEKSTMVSEYNQVMFKVARDASKAEADAKRKTIEAELEKKLADAEARIGEVKAAALKEVGPIAESTASAIMERLLEDISYEAPTPEHRQVKIDAPFVRRKLQSITDDEDLSRFIL